MNPDHILALMRQHGHLAYAGEGISQLQHGWQCARLAEAAGAPPALQLAAWLHDLGHLMGSAAGLTGTPTLQGIDDGHERVAAAALTPLFGAAVAEPVALHVQAKRCLVSLQPGYLAGLSADSQRSLRLQGGALDATERQHFQALPHSRDAMRLRVWDDQAKQPHLQPDSTEAALAGLQALMGQVQAATARGLGLRPA